MSESLQHDAVATFAHLQPILTSLPGAENIKTVHILSDGPTAQYRNKTVFEMLPRVMCDALPTATAGTWNYTAAGHGKGAPDGIGGVLKRTLDRLVAQGTDIPNFDAAVNALQGKTAVKICVIPQAAIKATEVPKNLKAFAGTMKTYQVAWSRRDGMVKKDFRRLSCFSCTPGERCGHYSLCPEPPVAPLAPKGRRRRRQPARPNPPLPPPAVPETFPAPRRSLRRRK